MHQRSDQSWQGVQQAADPPSSGGQILNQTTGVRAPVSAVSVLQCESESGR